jgi:uncharacterized membrane protein YjgN (DUF898 family)
MNDMRPPRGASVLPTVPAAESPATHQVVYDGRVGDLARIAVSNALLGLLSLGIYRFWGKTRLRQYLWGRVAFLGDRMEYSGTAKELLIGFLVALIILAPLIGGFMVVELAFEGDLKVIAAKELVQLLVILFVIQLAIYRARRYRLTRTQWRGIRAGQTGSAFKYGFLAFGWMIVAMLTLGLAYPVYRTRLQRYRTENTWFGDRRLEFRGEAAQLFGSWVLTWLLLLPTFGLIYAWYRAKEFRYFVSKTEYGALRFGSELSAVSVFLIYLAYYIAVSAVIGTVSGLDAGLVAGLHGPDDRQHRGHASQRLDSQPDADCLHRASRRPVRRDPNPVLRPSFLPGRLSFAEGDRRGGLHGHRPEPARHARPRRGVRRHARRRRVLGWAALRAASTTAEAPRASMCWSASMSMACG